MKTEQPPAPASPITLSVNCVVDGKWYAAGEPIPFTNAAAVPSALQPFIAVDEPDEPPGPPGMAFQPNRVYYTDAQGAILSPRGRREAARLAGEAQAQAGTVNSTGELPPPQEVL